MGLGDCGLRIQGWVDWVGQRITVPLGRRSEEECRMRIDLSDCSIVSRAQKRPSLVTS